MAELNESAGNGGVETMSADDEAYFASGGKTDVAEPEIVEEEIASADEPALEAEAEEPATEQEQPGQQKTVPHKALHAEREEHKRTKSELIEARERLARLDERTNMILAQMNQRQQPEQEQTQANPLGEIPDATVDPVGAIAWVTQQIAAQKQAEQEQVRQYQEQQQYEQQANAAIREADVVLTQAVQQDATVQEAFEFATNAVKSEIARMGYSGQQADQLFQQELVKFAANAPRDPQGIAERAKAVARYYGWTPQAANQQQSPADKITQLQKAVPANRSLSQASGKSTNLSAADIDSMSDGEFSEWLSKGGDAAWKRANGL